MENECPVVSYCVTIAFTIHIAIILEDHAVCARAGGVDSVADARCIVVAVVWMGFGAGAK